MSVGDTSDIIDERPSTTPANGGSLRPRAADAGTPGGDSGASGASRASPFYNSAPRPMGRSPRHHAAIDEAVEDDVEAGRGGAGGKGSEARRRQLLDPIGPDKMLTLRFRDIEGFVPIGYERPGAVQKATGRVRHPKHGLQQKERQIMFGLSGDVRPGEVTALMGPSGSGKTTLLSVLGGRPAKALRVTGSLLVNGQGYTKATRRRIGFVLQDDVLYEDLTVLETLRYAALLRLPRGMAREEKEARVEAVIDVLGVRKSRGTIIGGFLRRGISGGERKRVSIGHELLVNPAILMLDEPTSGLDSTSALHLLSLLRDLAADGRAILSTIHQPSSRLYTLLDGLMLLAEGHMLYNGPASDVVTWMGRFGLRVPFGTSIADFVLDAAMGEAGSTLSGNAGDAAVKELWAAFEEHSAASRRGGGDGVERAGGGVNGRSSVNGGWACGGGAKRLEGPPADSSVLVVDDDTVTPGDAKGYAAGYTSGYAGAGARRGCGPPRAVTGKGHAAVGGGRGGEDAEREGASYFDQVSVLVGRAVKVRRFEQLTGSHFFQLIFVAVIAGLVWWQRGSTYTRLNGADVLGLLFFELLFPSFRSLFHALFTFPNEYRMLMKERPAGLYRLSAYYLARTIADVPIELLNTVLFVVIAYWFGGLNRNAADFFSNLGVMVLVVMVAEAWGLLLGGVFMQPKKAQTATTVIMLTFLLVGGYYARSIPVWIGWIRFLSFLYWGFNLLTKIQFRRYQMYDCGGTVTSSSTQGYSPDDLAAIPTCTPIQDVHTTLGLPAPPHDPAWPDALILIAMLVALRVAIYYTLRVKTRTRKLLMV